MLRSYDARVYADGEAALIWDGLARSRAQASEEAIAALHEVRATHGLPPMAGDIDADVIENVGAHVRMINRIRRIAPLGAALAGGARPAPLKAQRIRRLVAMALAYGFPAHLRRHPAEAGIVWRVDRDPRRSPLCDVTLDGPGEAAGLMRPGTAGAICHIVLRCEDPAPNAHGYKPGDAPDQQVRMASQRLAGIPASASLRAAVGPARRAAAEAAARTLARFLEGDGQPGLAETIRRESSREGATG